MHKRAIAVLARYCRLRSALASRGLPRQRLSVAVAFRPARAGAMISPPSRAGAKRFGINKNNCYEEDRREEIRHPLRVSDVRISIAAALAAPAAAQSPTPKVGDPPEARNMRLVGMNDLQARSAYQPTIHKQGDRYIAYIGHHGGTPEVPKPLNPLTGQAEFNGTSIIDVTDPAKPKYLFHIPGQEGNFEAGGAQMVRVCDGSALPKGDRNAVYLLRSFGGAATRSGTSPIRRSRCWSPSRAGI